MIIFIIWKFLCKIRIKKKKSLFNDFLYMFLIFRVIDHLTVFLTDYSCYRFFLLGVLFSVTFNNRHLPIVLLYVKQITKKKLLKDRKYFLVYGHLNPWQRHKLCDNILFKQRSYLWYCSFNEIYYHFYHYYFTQLMKEL